MSEQLVIILLIALTLLIVLAALAIDEEPSPTDDALETSSSGFHSTVSVDTQVANESGRAAREMASVHADEGDPPDDARRTTDIPEAPGH